MCVVYANILINNYKTKDLILLDEKVQIVTPSFIRYILLYQQQQSKKHFLI